MYKANETASKYSVIRVPGGDTNTKQDAYRHMLLSADLCRQYFTVTSKNDRMDFAEAVGNMNEECGANKIHASAMDYHNNYIGRQIWNATTSYRYTKIFKWRITFGLNQPTLTTLLDHITAKVNGAIKYDEEGGDEFVKNQILTTDVNTAVYLRD